MKYATAAQLKQELGIDSGDTSLDNYLGALLDRVSAYIDLMVGYKFTAAEEVTNTDELYETGGRVVWLRQVNVTAVSAVSTKERKADDWTLLDGSTYDWRSNGRLELPTCAKLVKVTYKYLYPIPLDIELACLQIAAAAFRASGNSAAISGSAIVAERLGDLDITYATPAQIADAAMSSAPDALAILKSYRVRPV